MRNAQVVYFGIASQEKVKKQKVHWIHQELQLWQLAIQGKKESNLIPSFAAAINNKVH